MLVVINVGHPGEGAYLVRNERLPFDEVYRVV